MAITLRRCRSAAAFFWADTSGAILPYVTILLVVFVGTGVLALDGARFMSLQSQLQKAADALALHGAAELDRLPDAIARATNAVQNLQVSNASLFGPSGSQTVAASSIRFLLSLPADSAAISGADVLCTAPSCSADDAIRARFIEVTVQPLTITTVLPAAFFGGATSVTAGASAVAGNDSVSCGLTPMFVCNPYEQPLDTYAQASARLQAANADSATKRRLLRFADGAGKGPGTWGPGDFGYLEAFSGSLPSDKCFPNAGQNIATALAAERPLICVRQNGANLQTGNTTAAIDGLNTRFGLYSPSVSTACMESYPPDLNVRKGYVEGSGQPAERWCRGNPDGQPSGNPPEWPPGNNGKTLPVDSCFQTDTCSPGNMGSSNWDCAAYWSATYVTGSPPAGCTSAATISRYELYQYEIANNFDSIPHPVTGETGAPQCVPAAKKANRRTITVAIVNCKSSPVAIQSNATNVPVAAYAKFFLTVPVPVAAQNKPYGEFLGLVERGAGNRELYDQVQLYR